MSVARSRCHLFTIPLKSYNSPSYLSTTSLLFSSILPTLLPYPLPYQHHLRSGLRNPLSVTRLLQHHHPQKGGSRSNPVDHGRECPAIGVRVSPAGRMKNTAHPSTAEQVMMSAQTGGRHLCSEVRSYHPRCAHFWRVSVSHTHVDTLKSPAWNTAQRTYPTTALHINDAANAATRNVKSVSNA